MNRISTIGSFLVYSALVLAGVGCAPEIGDDCKTSLDCSSQASRLCDRTQSHGYCTIKGCELGTCPEEAVCVKFRPSEERLSVTYCMLKCSEDDDCRNDEGYRCTSAEAFGDAEILGKSSQQFCATPAPARAPTMSCEPSVDSGTCDDEEDAGR